jgi:hypothetical protein
MIQARVSTLLLVTGLVAIAPSSFADVVSSFDSDSGGWIAVDLASPLGDPPIVVETHAVDYFAAGGNPDGYISTHDLTWGWRMFSAPEEYLGNLSPYFGGSLTLDCSVDQPSSQHYPVVVLVSDQTALHYPAGAPGAGWTAFTVPLSPSGWRLGNFESGPEPTVAQMLQVLSNLTGLYVQADWVSGEETTGLDNVRLGGGSAGAEAGAQALSIMPRLFPNPCRGSATLRLAPGAGDDVHIFVYDPGGRLLKTVREAPGGQGDGAVCLDLDERCCRRSPGIYFVEVRTATQRTVHRLTVIRP